MNELLPVYLFFMGPLLGLVTWYFQSVVLQIKGDIAFTLP